jgi:hypothetical protein
MIEGKKHIKKEYFTKEEIYKLTSNGKDIYTKYIGRISRSAMKRPWGTDNHPSFGVWQAPDGIWMWKDQAREEAGNPIQLVERMFGLSYTDAIKKVCADFNWSDEQVSAVSILTDTQDKAEIKKEYMHISCRIQKFGPRHHAFWNSASVTEDWCKKFNCFAVKEVAVNHKKINIGQHEIVFVYLADDIDKVKLYFPDRAGGDRFRTNVPFNYLWRHNYNTSCDNLVIHKSMKDLIVFSQIHTHNVATQNESISVFNEELVKTVHSICPTPWLFYGADDDGMKKAKEITKKFGWKMINTPTSMLTEVNDVYSYVKQHGLKKLEELCKIKNLIQ